MSGKPTVPIEKLIESYEIHQSVWKVGEEVGLCGQSVHERLQKAGYKLNNKKYSKAERKAIRETYLNAITGSPIDLKGLAKGLGRPHTNISREARKMGLTVKGRQKTFS